MLCRWLLSHNQKNTSDKACIMITKQKKRFVYVLPFVLLLTTGAAFYFLPNILGQKSGYFTGFLFYWLFWCLTVPFLMISKKGIVDLFRIDKPVFGSQQIKNIFFLLLPLIFVYSYQFPKVIHQANIIIVISSLLLSIINATAEEILWRGTFLRVLGDNSKVYVLFSSCGFAMWHFAPQIVFDNKQPGGAVSFVAFAFVLGLLFSSVAKDTKSILLTTIVHTLFDFGGLGGRVYFN
jgi:membrane protease YdiL (CAAX protease family)